MKRPSKPSKARSSARKSTKPKSFFALNLYAWEDPYTLGAFIHKAGLHRYAREALPYLKNIHDQRTRLFRAGADTAHTFTWADLAYEIRNLRCECDTHERFNAFIRRSCPDQVCNRILSVIEEIRGDWETEQQIRVGRMYAPRRVHEEDSCADRQGA